MISPRIIAASALLALAACQSGPEGPAGTTRESPGEAFSAIGPKETIKFVGTEPFWGGEAATGSLTYSTPENQDGTTIAVVECKVGREGAGKPVEDQLLVGGLRVRR